jgi:AcrR family transcriptional regulator
MTTVSVIDVQSREADGRRVRREHNREAVVQALLSLYRSGELAPSVADIAEQAGLSARSLFRYFDDVDDLVQSAITRQRDRLAPLWPLTIDTTAPLRERISVFVRHRIRLFEEMGRVAQVARMRAPVQPLVAKELSAVRAELRDQLHHAFAPELSSADSSRTAAIDVLCSFESYQLLREDHGLSRARAATVLGSSLHALLNEGTS